MPWIPYCLLPPYLQQQAYARFSPFGRRVQRIEAHAFKTTAKGELHQGFVGPIVANHDGCTKESREAFLVEMDRRQEDPRMNARDRRDAELAVKQVLQPNLHLKLRDTRSGMSRWISERRK